MEKVQIRMAGTNDIDAVAGLFDMYRQFYRMDADRPRATNYIKARIENGESVVLVAEDNAGTILGFCQLYATFCSVFTAPICTLYDLFIDESHRHQGIGRCLIVAAEHYAKQQGAVRMDLRTAKTNTSAQALYESANWERDEKFFAYSKFISGPHA